MTKKEKILQGCNETVKEIRYYAQYPHSTLIGKWVSKWILKRLRRRLRGLEEQLLSILEDERKNRQTKK